MERNRRIIIVSGEINIGKTTSILYWINNNKSKIITGFLTPKIDGERVFYNIQNNEHYGMLAKQDESDCLEIGKYKFSATSFEKAIAQTIKSIELHPNFIVVDEIGKLELNGLGFHRLIIELLQIETNLILVVRNSLVEEVKAHYKLNESVLELYQITEENQTLKI